MIDSSIANVNKVTGIFNIRRKVRIGFLPSEFFCHLQSQYEQSVIGSTIINEKTNTFIGSTIFIYLIVLCDKYHATRKFLKVFVFLFFSLKCSALYSTQIQIRYSFSDLSNIHLESNRLLCSSRASSRSSDLPTTSSYDPIRNLNRIISDTKTRDN